VKDVQKVKEIQGKLLEIDYSKSVYSPAEDSVLLAESVSESIEENHSVLEIGCGTGFVCLQLAGKARHVTAVDINPNAVLLAKKNAKKNNIKNISVFESDLFSRISTEKKFNIIVFNPPYLPDDHIGSKDMLDKALIGGPTGREVLFSFFKGGGGGKRGVKDHLKENGKVFFVISSFTGQKEVEEKLTRHGFCSRVIASKKLFFETLFVYLAGFKKQAKNGERK